MNSVLSGFSNRLRPVSFQPNLREPKPMFAFDRSALAVLVPLALLLAVALYSNRAPDPDSPPRRRPSRERAGSDRRGQLAFEVT